MDNGIRQKLFDNYSSRVDKLDATSIEKFEWFNKYFNRFYFKVFQKFNSKDINILEVGCNRGYLLKVIKNNGYDNLVGIDLSRDDLELAKRMGLTCELLKSDAFEFLSKNKSRFDIIIIKAVLEHIPKDKIEELVKLMQKSLRSGGQLIIDVPNMDWFFASHERYMDFTHEVGFTKESLDQVVRLYFNKYQIFTADNIMVDSFFYKIRKKIARKFIETIFRWADSEGMSNPVWNRSLISVCEKD